jgi:hypothetical protein
MSGPRVVIWVRDFLWAVYRVGGKLSKEVRVTSEVPRGSVLGPLLFLAYVNDIWRNNEKTIRLFTDDCTIYKKITNNKDMKNLQTDLNRLGKWTFENEIIINPTKTKADCFTRARVMEPLNYSLLGHCNSGSKQL